MCYDVTVHLRSKVKYARHAGRSEEEIRKLELQLEKFDWQPHYRVDGFAKDRPKLPVITNEQPNEFQYFEWKYLSDSVMGSKKSLNTLNAKSETIFDSWTYKGAAQKRHCLVFVDGFFEPHGFGKVKEVKRYGKVVQDYQNKAYYYIESHNDEPLTIAGLWNTWTEKSTGEVHDTFTIITVPASPKLAKIHNVMARMPAILPKEIQWDWLAAANDPSDPTQKARSLDLLKPFEDDRLTWRPVYNIKKRDGYGDSPKTIETYDYSKEAGFELIS